MKGKTILFESAPFNYGPAATTLNVAEAMSRYGHRLILVARGPTGELAQRSRETLEVLPVASSQEAARAADLVVCNTDPDFAVSCLRRGLRVAVIDTLFWMWDSVDRALLSSELYLVQEFCGVDEQLERLGPFPNLARVGPLIRPQPEPIARDDRDDLLLVSLGGCDCSFVDGDSDGYPVAVLRVLERLAEHPGVTSRIVLSAGERTVARLEPLCTKIETRMFSNQEHVRLVRRARAIALSPGLTATMEAFEAATPVFFLPPQNYSQVLQLQMYTRAGAAPFAFPSLEKGWQLPYYLSEESAVRQVRDRVAQFVNDAHELRQLGDALLDFARSGWRQYDSGSAQGLRRSLGMNGAARAAELIDAVV